MKTKDKILHTAQNLFFRKGIDRTSVKEIAESANINIAALNYHFKSKENLVDIIFEGIIAEFAPTLPHLLESDLPIEEKVSQYITTLNKLLIKYNPHLPFFIMAIMQRKPEKILKLKIFEKLYNPEGFYKHLELEAEKGKINKVDPIHFFLSMLSLVGFPFAMQHLLMGVNNWTEEDFINFIKDREKMITELCLDILKGESKSDIV